MPHDLLTNMQWPLSHRITRSIALADVFAPPTTSTNGIRCGGLNGCPVTQRSGCLHSDWIRLIGTPEVLDTSMAGSERIESIREQFNLKRLAFGGIFLHNVASRAAKKGFLEKDQQKRTVAV